LGGLGARDRLAAAADVEVGVQRGQARDGLAGDAVGRDLAAVRQRAVAGGAGVQREPDVAVLRQRQVDLVGEEALALLAPRSEVPGLLAWQPDLPEDVPQRRHRATFSEERYSSRSAT